MKHTLNILILWFLPLSVWTQQLTIDQCYKQGYIHHPSYNNIQLLLEMEKLELSNANASMLPQASLKANVSWQSDVTTVDLPMAGLDLPELSHDWYKLYIDVTQTIFDGGINRTKKTLTSANTQVELQKQEVNLYAVKGNVNIAFFSALHLQMQLKILSFKNEILDKQINRMRSAVKNGASHQSDLNNLLAEKILLKQQIIEMQSIQHTALDNLSLITGKTINHNTTLQIPSCPDYQYDTLNIHRPELELLTKQKVHVDAHSELIKNARKPQIFGYGQAGYGRPGLNMFNDDFDDWYLIGIGMQWKIYDWKESSRKQTLLTLQKNMIDVQKDNFLYKLNMLIASKTNEISKLNRIISSDTALIRLRKSIADNAASQLKNGSITSADYIRDLNTYMSAQLTSQSHKVLLLKAQYEYLTITGTETY